MISAVSNRKKHVRPAKHPFVKALDGQSDSGEVNLKPLEEDSEIPEPKDPFFP